MAHSEWMYLADEALAGPSVESTHAIRSKRRFSAHQIMPTKKKSSSARELIEPKKGDKRFVRRNKKGEFDKVVDVGRSLSADKRKTAKKTVPKGQGDRGDTKR